MTNHKIIGNIGEEIAQNYLQRQGCKIIQRNYYSRFGEIDIIAEKDNILLFVEVKYRKNERFALATESITSQKKHNMRLTIETYLQKYPTNQPLRIDLITIIGQSPYQITWLENIF